MNELFLQIYVPSITKNFDVKVSPNLRMYELRAMLFDLISLECNIDLLKKSNAVLCDKETGAIFNINMSVRDLKVRNGSSLMLL